MGTGANYEELAAEKWFGYGRWKAHYWFVGPEPGMKKAEGDNLAARCRAWADLSHGRSLELIDCREHHEKFREVRLFMRRVKMKLPVVDHTMRPPTQDTWRRLIALLLAYTRQRIDNDMIGEYQCEEWGSLTGDTCVVELSALAARNLGVERDREAFRKKRVETLRKRLLSNSPEFVVFYGLRSRDDYEQIAGGSFDPRGYRWSGNTLCVLVEHPTARPGQPASMVGR